MRQTGAYHRKPLYHRPAADGYTVPGGRRPSRAPGPVQERKAALRRYEERRQQEAARQEQQARQEQRVPEERQARQEQRYGKRCLHILRPRRQEAMGRG